MAHLMYICQRAWKISRLFFTGKEKRRRIFDYTVTILFYTKFNQRVQGVPNWYVILRQNLKNKKILKNLILVYVGRYILLKDTKGY